MQPTAHDGDVPGLWTRSGPWRWTLSATLLATAVVVLVAPWRKPDLQPVSSLATYSAPAPKVIARVPSTMAPPTPVPVMPGAAPAPVSRPGNAPVDPDMAALPAPTATAPPVSASGGSSSTVRWQSTGQGTVTGGGLVAEYCCAGASSTVYATSAVSSGKHYVELSVSVRPGATSTDTWTTAGIAPASDTAAHRPIAPQGNPLAAARRSLSHGDTVMMALDMDAGRFYWGVNGRWQNAEPGDGNGEPLLAGTAYRPFATLSASSSKQTPEGDKWIANFGSRPFKYGPPRGYGAYGSATAPTVRSAASSAAAAPEDPYLNRFFSDSVTVAGTSVPLPEGRWRGLGHVQGSDRNDQTVLLGRITGDRLAEFAAIRVQSQPSGQGFDTFPSCGRKDLYAGTAVANEKGGEQLCWWVNHAVQMWNQPAFSLAKANLAGLQVAAPSTMINSGFRKAGKTGAVTAFYYVNPEAAGFTDAAADWRASPWHRDNVASDPARKAYLDSRVEWTKNWMPLFKVTH